MLDAQPGSALAVGEEGGQCPGQRPIGTVGFATVGQQLLHFRSSTAGHAAKIVKSRGSVAIGGFDGTFGSGLVNPAAQSAQAAPAAWPAPAQVALWPPAAEPSGR